MVKNDLVSITIPAYNKPDYLEKCLDSIINQTYRPIEIIISDDNSPIDLTPIVERIKLNTNIRFVFERQKLNLRPYWNHWVNYRKAEGRYLIFMPHDDWFICANYIQSAIDILNSKQNCFIAIANSFLEGTEQKFMNYDLSEWTFIDGIKFNTENLYTNLHPAYSAVVVDNHKLKSLGYEDLIISKADSFKMKIEPDESFIMISMLASVGDVAVTGKIVSVRGNPPDSYSKSKFWRKKGSVGVAIPYIKLMQYYQGKNNNILSRFYKKLVLTKYNVTSINKAIFDYFDWKPEILFLLIGSWIINKSAPIVSFVNMVMRIGYRIATRQKSLKHYLSSLLNKANL